MNIEKFGRKKPTINWGHWSIVSLSGVGVLFAMGSKFVIIPLLMYVASFAF